jgi:starch synthase
MINKINIAYLSSEAVPFVKVGGLADVAGSLPKSLVSLKENETNNRLFDVRVVLPLHRSGDLSKLQLEEINSYYIDEGIEKTKITAYKTIINGVLTYFLDFSFLERFEEVYSSIPEIEQEKYIIFSLAAVRFFQEIDWRVDILHVNDWHTALCMSLIKTPRSKEFYNNTKGILSVHNLKYMGGNCSKLFNKYDISPSFDPDLPEFAADQPLPIGLVYADKVVPVSEEYALEIQTPEFGCGLEKYLYKNKYKITGIINGLDTEYWNPGTDSLIINNYDIQSLDRRNNNKLFLQQLLHLDINEINIPIIGMVTRIDQQKGIDLAIKVLNSLESKKWQLVILGTGDPILESEIMEFQRKHRGRVEYKNSYDENLAHKIYAGADIFFMPSRYEPCGLSQMIANRYGCIPVVTGVGGLKDTIINNKNGFVSEMVLPDAIQKTLNRAIAEFKDKDNWNQLQCNGMGRDYSWTNSARKYAELYIDMQEKRGEK